MMDGEFLTTLIANLRAPSVAEGMPLAFVPDGMSQVSTEKYLPKPATKRGTFTFSDSDSLIAYVKQHKIEGRTTVYADIDLDKFHAQFIAVLNDHGGAGDAQDWGHHRAVLTPVQTTEWRRWLASNSKPMDQAAFATFLEDNLPDIANVEGMPTGAQILAMSMNFQHNADNKFKQVVNLQGGGVRLEYVEDADKDTRTQMEVFKQFSLGLRPFLNGQAYRLDARLKYRTGGGSVNFFYELVRSDRVFHDAVNGEIAKIKEALDGAVPVLFGKPAQISAQ